MEQENTSKIAKLLCHLISNLFLFVVSIFIYLHVIYHFTLFDRFTYDNIKIRLYLPVNLVCVIETN